MATLTELNKKSEVEMPSRAKYYYNEDTADFSGTDISAPTRYDGFIINKVADKTIKNIAVKNEEVKIDLQKGNPDILPSSATLRMLSDKYKAPEKPFDNSEVSCKLNSKGKFIFAIYAVVVLSLLLIIVLNAIAVNRQTNFNAQLKNDINFASEKYTTLRQQSDSLADENRIYNAALSYGMTEKAAIKVKLDIPQSNQNVKYTAQSNWFDRLCDLLS